MGVVYAFIGLLAVAIGGLITFAVLNHRAKNEQLAARDMLDKEREQHRVTAGELTAEIAAHETTRKSLAAEQKLRATVEVQRNDAYRQARDYYVERLKGAGVADAIRIIDDLLSAPLPSGMSKEVPAGDPATTEDDLLAPAGLQSPR